MERSEKLEGRHGFDNELSKAADVLGRVNERLLFLDFSKMSGPVVTRSFGSRTTNAVETPVEVVTKCVSACHANKQFVTVSI